MSQQNKQKRSRGLILTRKGWQKLENAKLEREFQEKYNSSFTIEELSDRAGVTPVTFRKVLTREVGVDKQTLVRLFMVFDLELEKSDYTKPDRDLAKQSGLKITKRIDWGEAVCTSVFYGRTQELNTLERWLTKEHCRVLALLGMGGIGKSSLAVKLAQQVQEQFEYVIWRSLYNAPPLFDLLANLIQFVSNEQVLETELPKSVEGRISCLIGYLQQRRCLIILDNVETIMRGGVYAGCYRDNYEDYGQLIKQVGEVSHQSSLVLTSREKPREVASLEGQALAVRSFHLSGLEPIAGHKIFEVKGLCGSKSELTIVVDRYAGNALALKIVATTIKDVFDSNISEFLKQDTTVFGDISHLLDQHYSRLSELEKDIIYWLVINREPVSLSELREDIVSPMPVQKLLEGLESLVRRCLIDKATSSPNDKSTAVFTLQPVVMEYVTQRMIEKVCHEIETENFAIFKCHALMKATSKDYVRETQIRLIVKPVVDELFSIFRSKQSIENKLTQIIKKLREIAPLERSYTAGNILNLFSYLKTDISSYDFSYLSVWQADLRCVYLHNTNFSHASLVKSVFAQTFSGILSVAFSPNGKFLATGDMNGEIHLYQVKDWKQLFTCQGHTDWVSSIAFSPDSSLLVSGSEDQTIKFWKVITGECVKTLQGHEDGIWSVAFSPDGSALASASSDRTIKIWNISTNECINTLRGHTHMVREAVFSLDNQMIVSCSVDKTLKLWNVKTGQCLITFKGHQEAIWSVSLSPDGLVLASSSSDQTIKLWDIITGQCLMTLQGHSGWIWSVAFNPNGKILASGCWDQTVKLWDVSTGECLRTLRGHNNLVRTVAFSPDGQILATGSEDQSLRLWNVFTSQCLRTLQGYGDKVWSLALSPDCQILASSSEQKIVKLWDINTSQSLGTLTGHDNATRSVAFSPKGNILASGGNDKTIRIWDLDTGNCYRILQGHGSWVWSVAFSPDGYTLASGSSDYTVKLWDIKTGHCLKTLHEESHGVLFVAFSPDGHTLASSSTDNTIKLWDVKTGQCLKTLQGHNNWIWSVAFSPDGQILSSSSHDHTLKLWDVKTGQCLKTLQGHSGAVWSVAFHPNENILCSGSIDSKIKLWDVKTGQCLKTLYNESYRVLFVTFSCEGYTLISGSEDGTIRVWDASTGKCIKSLRSKKPYEGMNVNSVTGLTEATIATLKILGAVDHQLEASKSN